jgi:hypothetical protein
VGRGSRMIQPFERSELVMPRQSYGYALNPADLSAVACVLRLKCPSEVGAVVYRGPRLGASSSLAHHLSGGRAVKPW